MRLGDTEQYKPLTRADIVQRQAEGKLSPIASFALTLLRGRTFIGDEVSVPKEIGLRLTPMVIQDVYDLAKENPKLLPTAAFALYGGGIQTYGPRKKDKKGPPKLKRGESKKERKAIRLKRSF